MVRITYVGAGFLALVAIIPSMIAGSLGVSFMIASFYGGTGLLIAVSVAFDLVQKIDSHLVMRNYPGLLEILDVGTRRLAKEDQRCQIIRERQYRNSLPSLDSVAMDRI